MVGLLLQSERPDTMLGVICGAVHIAEAGINKRYVNFKSALERYGLCAVWEGGEFYNFTLADCVKCYIKS